MDLNEILVFNHVVETGSFTAAAKKLGMPKSTVSRRVSALEARLGVRLLHRTTRQLRPTDVGATFHKRCAGMLLAIAEAERAVTHAQENPKGLLRVTAPVDFGQRVLPPLMADFLRCYPDVEIELHLAGEVIDLVAEGFDVALRAARQLPDSSLIARKLGKSQRLIVASPSYLEDHELPIKPHHLKRHNFIQHTHQKQRSTLELHSAAKVEKISVSGNVYVNEYGMVRALALTGMGLATIPDIVCAADIRCGKLVHVLPDWHMADASIYAVYPSAQHISATLREFLDFLRAQMTPVPWNI